MAKKLIVLSDGTGNSSAKLFKTNVWKLYEALDLTPSSDQIALYDDGVGTSRFKPWALLTGALGFGLKRNVLKMYVFLSRHYHLQKETAGEAPEIYAFGFSRGAFTVRVLAGLVIRQGLIPAGSEAEMVRMAVLSYRRYRAKNFHTKLRVETPFRWLRDRIVGVIDLLRKRPDYDPSMNTTDVGFRFLGVWDTVAAYGMPIEELRVAIDKLIFPMTFTSFELLPQVACARHALSIDDERSSFAPMLWKAVDCPRPDCDRLKQIWFAGMHANVGGGYPDDSLSRQPLAWMAMEASQKGLGIRPEALKEIVERATPYGKMYGSRSGLGCFYRYKPREICCELSNNDIPIVHESVVVRMATGFQGYAPIALPKLVRVIDKKGQVHQFGGYTQARAQRQLEMLTKGKTAAPEADETAQLAALIARLKTPDAAAVNLVRAAVLRRRFAYSATLACTLALVLFPLVAKFLPLPDNEEQAVSGALSAASQYVTAVTPSYLLPWLNAVVGHPFAAGILILVFLLAYRRNKVLGVVVADRSRTAWNIGKNAGIRQGNSRIDALALKLLASQRAKDAWTFTVSKLFPAVVFVLAAFAVVVFTDRTAFWVRSSTGTTCQPSKSYAELTAVSAKWEKLEFPASEPCFATGLRVSKDYRYEISIELPADTKKWRDADKGPDLKGINFKELGWGEALFMYVGAVFRRHLSEAWFVPIARVGQYGSDERALVSADPAGETNPSRKVTGVLAPRTNGELFLFVNDAYSGLLPLAWLEEKARSVSGGWARHLYGNNVGTADVRIRREGGQLD